MKSRGKLKDVQFISYRQLARDILVWSNSFDIGYYKGIIGIPRSGLTCAHMLSTHLNCPCFQLDGKTFRQSSGRSLNEGYGPYLVIDDTASYGTTMIEMRNKLSSVDAEYAAVYAREEAFPHLDHWFGKHEEPDWLVITEWNWSRHQDREYIAITSDLYDLGFRFSDGFDAIYDHTSDFIKQYKNSGAAVLFTRSNCQNIANASGKPVVCVDDMCLYRSQY